MGPETIGRPRDTFEYPGRFREDDYTFVPSQFTGVSPFGSMLVAPDSSYIAELNPDGSGSSRLGKTRITSSSRHAKTWLVEDRESKALWQPFASLVATHHDHYHVEYRPGVAQIVSISNKIASSLTMGVACGGTREIWIIKLQNLSARHRSIKFTVYVEPCFERGDTPTSVVLNRAVLLRKESQTREYSDCSVYYLYSTVPAAGAFTSTSILQEVECATASAVAVLDNQIKRDVPILCLTIDLEIPLEGEAVFGLCLGASGTEEVAGNLISQDPNVATLEDSLRRTQEHWHQLANVTMCHTPDHTLDALMNVWLPYSIGCALIEAKTYMPAFRPPSEMLKCALPFVGPMAAHYRELLLDYASALTSLETYSPDGISIAEVPTDDLLWFAYALSRYAMETGDTAVLDKHVNVANGISLTFSEVAAGAVARHISDALLRGKPVHPIALAAASSWQKLAPELFCHLAPGCVTTSEMQPSAFDLAEMVPAVGFALANCPTLLSRRDILCRWLEPLTRRDQSAQLPALYCAITSDILGIRIVGTGLEMDDTAPYEWDEYTVIRSLRSDLYCVRCRRTKPIEVDSESSHAVSLVGDGRTHYVELEF